MKKSVSVAFKIVITAIFILSIAASAYFYYQYDKLLKTNQQLSQKQIDSIVASVGKLMDLPKNEKPTIATVTDASKLRSQEFFKKAANGDQVLIYPQAKRAILFRGSDNKIIDVAPVVIQNEGNVAGANTQQAAESGGIVPQAPKVSVAMYNGTSTAGLTYKVETPLTAKFTDVEIATRQASLGKNYQKTIVIDVSKKFSAKAKEISTFLNVPITTLPPAEKAPTADILIIVGLDKNTP